MSRWLLAALALLAAIATAGAWTHGRVAASSFPLGAAVFYWLPNGDFTAQDAWLTGGATTGVTSTSYDSTISTARQHAAGLGVVNFLGGPCGDNGTNVTSCLGNEDTYYAAGVNTLVTDEIPCPATATLLTNWQTLINHWKAINPTGTWVLDSNDPSGNCELGYLNGNGVGSGLTGVDYVQWEDYAGLGVRTTNPFIVNGLHSSYPAVKMSILIYGSTTLCSYTPTVLNGLDSINYWEVNNDGVFAAKAYMSPDWLANAETYVTTGSASSWCVLPSSVWSSASGSYNSNFTMTVLDLNANTTSYTPAGTCCNNCEYRVMVSSGGANLRNAGPANPLAVETLGWTTRTCSGTTPTITVGAGGNCNVSTHGTALLFTCLVEYRAHNSNGTIGNMQYTLVDPNF